MRRTAPLLVLVLVMAACGGNSGTTPSEELEVGDCYNGDTLRSTVEVVPCDGPHDGEVVTVGKDVVEKQSESGMEISIGGGAKGTLADCLGVREGEVDHTLSERGLSQRYIGGTIGGGSPGFIGHVVESESDEKVTGALCVNAE